MASLSCQTRVRRKNQMRPVFKSLVTASVITGCLTGTYYLTHHGPPAAQAAPSTPSIAAQGACDSFRVWTDYLITSQGHPYPMNGEPALEWAVDQSTEGPNASADPLSQALAALDNTVTRMPESGLTTYYLTTVGTDMATVANLCAIFGPVPAVPAPTLAPGFGTL